MPKKMLSLILIFALFLSCTPTVLASTEEEALKQEIIDYIVTVNTEIGYIMTQEEIDATAAKLQFLAEQYCTQNNTTISEAYESILAEMQASIPLCEKSLTRSGGKGSKQLPYAETGDIFFVDADTAWNHVGLYTDTDWIVQAMPDDGVQFRSIGDSRSYQEPVEKPVDGSDDSCILRVTSLSSTKIKAAAEWPKKNVPAGTPYDYDFYSNKKDYELIDIGTDDLHEWIEVSESISYNCSELVWKAFKKGAGVDLDANGGYGVYPNDILNSSLTVIVQDNIWKD